jgi:uncharacterized protein YbjT (DUF2867 family)
MTPLMILLTGATGNIGTELVKLLVAKGASLRVVSRDEKKVAQLDPRIERRGMSGQRSMAKPSNKSDDLVT